MLFYKQEQTVWLYLITYLLIIKLLIMAEPFIGEIKMVSFGWNPENWVPCDGRMLQINQFQSLYSLIGTQFGGDGRNTFGVPDLRGRTPLQPQGQIVQGYSGGLENVAISANELPTHSHLINACGQDADQFAALTETETFAKPTTDLSVYGDSENLVSFNTLAVSKEGSSSVYHSNIQPTQVVNFVMAIQGTYPRRP